MKNNLTIEEAVLRFTQSYKDHLVRNSPASRMDPRECKACQKAFDDLILACNRLDAPIVISGSGSNNVIDLFNPRNAIGIE